MIIAKHLSLFLCLVSLYSYGKTVVDQKNIPVQIPDHVSRVVSIPIPMASMIITIDQGTQRLAGINRASHNDFTEGFLPNIYPGVANIPYDIAGDGFAPNVETLMNLHPDVVIQWGDMGNQIIKPIQDTGLPVVTTIYGETRYVTDWMRIIGEVLGKTRRANQLADWFNTGYENIKLKNHQSDQQKPRVIYLSRYATGLVVAGQHNSFQGDIEITGGINAASELHGISPVNVEQLILWDPQIILLSTFEADLTPKKLYADPRLQNLAAIKNKRVYSYPRGGFRWDPPSQESILTLNWMSLLFHPQQANAQQMAQDFRLQMKQTYQLLYDYSLNETETDHILRISDNKDSASYCELFCLKQ